MTLNLNDFAAELLHCIFHFCSQSDLASLSQVNSSFKHAAEDILYRHIYTSFYPFDLIPDKTWRSWTITEKSLIHTLASYPQKAALIRSLHVQFEYTGPYNATQANCSILERIADALYNALDLVDLRIMVDENSDDSEGNLSEALRTGCFQLHTLYCESFQDLEGNIVNQVHLRLLGIYDIYSFGFYYSGGAGLVKILRKYRNLPGIFVLGSYGSINGLSQLTLFPELCRPGQAFTLCRDIVTSLGQDLGKRYDIGSDNYHWGLEIQVAHFSHAKAAMICEMVEVMAERFVDCHAFSMVVQNSTVEGIVSKPWRIPGLLLTSISRFKQLQRLCFSVYLDGDDSLYQVAMDLRSLLLNESVPACPTLVECGCFRQFFGDGTLDFEFRLECCYRLFWPGRSLGHVGAWE